MKEEKGQRRNGAEKMDGEIVKHELEHKDERMEIKSCRGRSRM